MGDGENGIVYPYPSCKIMAKIAILLKAGTN
jgi:hypothetical protein